MDVRVVDAKLESVETELVVVGMFVPAQMTAELKAIDEKTNVISGLPPARSTACNPASYPALYESSSLLKATPALIDIQRADYHLCSYMSFCDIHRVSRLVKIRSVSGINSLVKNRKV